MAVVNSKPTYYTSTHGTKINVTGLGGSQLKKVQNLANTAHGKKAQRVANRFMIPKASTPAVTPPNPDITHQPGALPPPAATPPPAEANPDAVNALFPSTRMFEPKNYEGSPLYQFQLQEGNKQVARSLAKRGLTNSGRGIEEELNVPLRAAAQDTDRMTRIASENADRLYNMQNNEALRQERAGNEQWNRGYSLAELMSRQSPMDAALAGLNNTANTTSDMGQDQANFLRQFFQRSFPSGGSNRGGTPEQPIPVPTGPNYSNTTPTQIAGDYSSNNGWLNLLTKGIGSLFG